MPLSGKDSLNFLFMGGSTALIAHGALARQADGPDGYMRLHPFLMGLAFSLMISLGFWMFLDEAAAGGLVLCGETYRTINVQKKVVGFHFHTFLHFCLK